MIYTINTSNYLLYPVIKSYWSLTDMDVYKMINNEHSKLLQRLSIKHIEYNNLKRALIPNQEKDKKEGCFIFDSLQINFDIYGSEIFNKLIPVLDRESTYSILAGDYIDILQNVANSQSILKDTLEEMVIKYNSSIYQHSNQYFLIYINSMTEKQIQSIIEVLKEFHWFYGYADVNLQQPYFYYKKYLL